jgi:RNA polymerase-interacting CarD/CdnL/TRCF family regulator
MSFAMGSKWAYGPHGIGEVKRTERVDRQNFLFLWFSLRSATIKIDTDNASRNLRPPLDEAGAAQVLAVLKGTPGPVCISWVRRVRGYKDKLAHGLPEELAEIYRDIGRRTVISYSEKRFFEQAKTLLVQELSLIWSDAEQRIKETAQCIR